MAAMQTRGSRSCQTIVCSAPVACGCSSAYAIVASGKRRRTDEQARSTPPAIGSEQRQRAAAFHRLRSSTANERPGIGISGIERVAIVSEIVAAQREEQMSAPMRYPAYALTIGERRRLIGCVDAARDTDRAPLAGLAFARRILNPSKRLLAGRRNAAEPSPQRRDRVRGCASPYRDPARDRDSSRRDSAMHPCDVRRLRLEREALDRRASDVFRNVERRRRDDQVRPAGREPAEADAAPQRRMQRASRRRRACAPAMQIRIGEAGIVELLRGRRAKRRRRVEP